MRTRVSTLYHKLFDAGTGYMYYFNTVTGVSSWVKPLQRVLGDSDLDMTPRTTAAVLLAYPPAGPS